MRPWKMLTRGSTFFASEIDPVNANEKDIAPMISLIS